MFLLAGESRVGRFQSLKDWSSKCRNWIKICFQRRIHCQKVAKMFLLSWNYLRWTLGFWRLIIFHLFHFLLAVFVSSKFFKVQILSQNVNEDAVSFFLFLSINAESFQLPIFLYVSISLLSMESCVFILLFHLSSSSVPSVSWRNLQIGRLLHFFDVFEICRDVLRM